MNSEFSYKALILSSENDTLKKCESISQKNKITFLKASSTLDALELLMDINVDIILIDLKVGEEDALAFLDTICEDYENKLTPILLIAPQENTAVFAKKTLAYNVLSILSNTNWDIQVTKQLNFLKIQKLNLHFIQDSLIESEGRGTMDNLTGAYNRYGCEDMFHTLVSREKAYDEPFCALMLDIDHFKNINDTHGHSVGDEVLVSLTNLIMTSIRRDDSLIRLGGEEFIIFISNANINIALRRAENIRTQIQTQMHSHKRLKVTASFGVAQFQEQERMDELFKRIDGLLYQAKESGRNKVVS
ncbi:diguanylate cyclase [Sulfurimonas sp. SAG-AH-194-I05]|nr:diguanylate cyclase [Sulfurimonas sp. SAG-AH-194-I05]MDF1874239.1 diguanylate cyclase [Sulfurimonas sp. SAG-AH-194-I05]